MTAPIRPDSQLPPLHRILTEEEFEQARRMSSTALNAHSFPAAPPLAPRESTRTGAEAPNPHAIPLKGLGRILTQYVAAPIMDHPLTTAATALIPGAGVVMGGLMAKDIVEYAAQKGAEMTLAPEDRARAEADPERIPGERAAVELGMLGAAPLVHAGMKAVKGAGAGTSAKLPIDLTAEPARLADSAPTDPIAAALQEGEAARTELKKRTPAEQTMIEHDADVSDAVSQIAPGRQAQNILRAATGEAAAVYEQAAFKLDEFRRAIEPLRQSDKLGFIDAIENGRSQPSELFQKSADVMRQALDKQLADVQALGTGRLEHYIEDYFPHMWEDPDLAAQALEAMRERQGLQGPAFEGSKASLQRREIPTTLDGVRLGLTPKFSNPVDLFLYKLRDMQKYIVAHQSLNEMKDANLVKFVRSGDARPDGWQRINDKIARVMSVDESGQLILRGEYYAPREVATIVNNYLSPGLPQILRNTLKTPAGDLAAQTLESYRGLGNTMNQFQLGLSAFHLGMTSLDAAVSRNALALEYLAGGKPLAAAKKAATAPLAPLPGIIQGGAEFGASALTSVAHLVNRALGTSLPDVPQPAFRVGLGAKIRDAYLNPESASPQMQALANAVKMAGGRIKMDSYYKNSAPEKMLEAWKAGQPVKAAMQLLPAAVEFTTKPLMEHIVPLQKLTVFGEMAQKALADMPLDAPLAERRAVLAKAWDSVDNRMGQLVYDNLFWHKAWKDLAMASVRSVGWNLGTIRELGGGIADLATNAAKLPKGEVALTHRAAYAVVLPFTVGMYSAAYQYLRTGEGPQELKDYFYPRTGETDADGNAERVQLPSYVKDLVAYAGDPVRTVGHKVSPLPAAVLEMLQNEDFYGDQIRNPNDPLVTQLQQEAEHVAKQFLPFALTGAIEQQKRGDQSPATIAGGFFGITPAPRAKVRSEAQNLMADYLSQRRMIGTSPEDAEARTTRRELLSALRSANDEGEFVKLQQRVTDAIERHQMAPRDVVGLLKIAGSTPAQERFKRLSMQQAVNVFQRSTPTEQAMFAEALLAKIERATVASR